MNATDRTAVQFRSHGSDARSRTRILSNKLTHLSLLVGSSKGENEWVKSQRRVYGKNPTKIASQVGCGRKWYFYVDFNQSHLELHLAGSEGGYVVAVLKSQSLSTPIPKMPDS